MSSFFRPKMFGRRPLNQALKSTRGRAILRTAFLGLSPLFLAPLLHAAPSFEGVGDLPGGVTGSIAFGVSGDGSTVVGQSFASSGLTAFRWQNGVLSALPDLPGGDTFSTAAAVNFDGTIIVGTSKGSIGFNEIVTWNASNAITGYGDLPGGVYASTGTGISASGNVLSGGGDSFSGTEALRVVNGVMSGLGDIPGGGFLSDAHDVSADGSIIVGIGRGTAPEYEAVRWVNGSLQQLGKLSGGADYSSAEAISADGLVIVGWSGSAAAGGGNLYEAFRWENNVMQGLGDLPGGDYASEAYATNDDGSVVVGRSRTANGWEAFIWDATNGMRRLQDVLVNEYNLNLTGWTLTRATDISDDGLTIVGEGLNPQSNGEGWVARITRSGGGGDPIDCSVVLDSGLASGSNTFIRRAPLAQTFRPQVSGLVTSIIHGLDQRGGMTEFNAYITTTDRSGIPPLDYERNNLWAGLGLTAFSSGSQTADGEILIPGNETFRVTAGVAYALILEPAESSGSMSWRGVGDANSYGGGTALELRSPSGPWLIPTAGPLDHTFRIVGCDGPAATYVGSCPGQVTVEIRNATPTGTVAVLFAATTGSAVIPGNQPCPGTPLGLGSTALQLVGTIGADSNGAASFSGNAPAAACGGYLQLLDLGSCRVSNVVQVN